MEDGGKRRGWVNRMRGKLREGKLGGNGAMEGGRPRTTCGKDSRRPSKGDGEVIKRPKTSEDGRNFEENTANKMSSRQNGNPRPQRDQEASRTPLP